MNSHLSSMVDSKLYKCLKEMSNNDIVLQHVLKGDSNPKEFINSLMAGIVCIAHREQENEHKIAELLNANPEIQKILKDKHDAEEARKSEVVEKLGLSDLP